MSGTRSVASSSARRTLEKRVLLSKNEDRDLRELVARVSRATDCPLSLSHLMRSTLKLLIESRVKIGRAAKATGPLKRPANSNLRGQRRFETVLSDIVKRGLSE